MSEKKIKSYTIVPSSLYVRREADKQLQQIIDDMGRPGYVLVSRQMGKTNLLLNAKRIYDKTGDCFTYIDISNTFSDLRSFFRSIIDTVVESAESKLSLNLSDLAGSRKDTCDLQPHKEHEYELRSLLKALPGKLIICLDEIDALTKVDYSDQVFSLIRSIYFSGRTNFQEFSNLTYVLSGVADPADLIKNKAISPFNIGEKIYLDDFSMTETEQFLQNCNVSIGRDVVGRVYYWASGNPRLTWDICSALEDKLILGSVICEEDVDEKIKELYLTNFDLPPIDHIRARVELDMEVREAVLLMHEGRSSDISDRVKDKLYLAGIATSKRSGGVIGFKNKIVEESLSAKWLHDLRTPADVAALISSSISNEKYGEALALLESSIKSAGGEVGSDIYLQTAICKAMLTRFEEAIEDFSKVTGVEDAARYLVLHWSGICKLRLALYDEAAKDFKAIIDSEPSPERGNYYYQAILNLSSVYFRRERERQSEYSDSSITQEIQILLDTIISSEREMRLVVSPADAQRILCSAHYQEHSFCLWKKDFVAASDALEKAWAVAEENEKITVAFERFELLVAKSDKANALRRCVQAFVEAGEPIREKKPDTPLTFTKSDCIQLITELYKFKMPRLVDEVIDKLVSLDTEHVLVWDIVGDILNASARQGEFAITLATIMLAVDREFKSVPRSDRKYMLSLGSLMSGGEQGETVRRAFYKEYMSSVDYEFDMSDIVIIGKLISAGNEVGAEKNSSVLKISTEAINKALAVGKLGADDAPIAQVYLEYWNIIDGLRLGLSESLVERVSTLRLKIGGIKNFSMPMISPSAKDDLVRSLNDIEIRWQATLRKELGRKFGRNEIITIKFNDGRIQTGKFKKLEEHLVSKRAELVSR